MKVSAHTITSHVRRDRVRHLLLGGRRHGSTPATWPIRAAAIALAAVWLLRTWRKEKPFLAQAAAPVVGRGGRRRRVALDRQQPRAALRRARGPLRRLDDKTVAAKEGLSLLEIAESNGMTIESGCRMGICGADPVAIKDGMDCLCGISDDEKATLERLGLAPNTRMACCARVEGPVSVALKPDKADGPEPQQGPRLQLRQDVANVVVIGNGIAGVTAVDHLRRRHPVTRST